MSTSHPNKVTDGARTIWVSKFHNESRARSFAARATKAWIVLGDTTDQFGAFWVCRPVDAARLERAGYEIA